MYHWVRTYSAKVGKGRELTKLSKQAAAYLRKTLKIKCHAYTAIGGDPMAFGLHGEYASMADIGKAEKKLSSDAGWAALLKKAAPMLVDGSASDQFWKEIT